MIPNHCIFSFYMILNHRIHKQKEGNNLVYSNHDPNRFGKLDLGRCYIGLFRLFVLG